MISALRLGLLFFLQENNLSKDTSTDDSYARGKARQESDVDVVVKLTKQDLEVLLHQLWIPGLTRNPYLYNLCTYRYK
jgi:hypothetical protein